MAAIILGAARKHWLPASVVELTPELIDHFRSLGYPVNDEIAEMVQTYPLPKLDDLRFSPTGKSYEDKREKYCELIKTLVPGMTQIILRPAVESQGLKLLSADWQQRVWDAKLLRDEKVAEVMKVEGVIVTNWREVMKRYEGEPSESTKSIEKESNNE